MSDYIQRRILNALLDKYERSSFYVSGIRPTRRIMLNFYNNGRCDFTYYDIEKSERRIAVNRAVQDLDEEGLLLYDWMRGEQGHIVSKVWLNPDNLSAAYRVAGREPKGDLVERVAVEIGDLLDQVTTLTWAGAYLRDVLEEIKRKRSLISAVPADSNERAVLFQAIKALDKLNGAELMERVFSMKTFGDSKTFELVAKPRLLSILRKYMDIDDEDATDDDILKQIGIVLYPEQFDFCGKLSLRIDGQIVDYSCLPGGGSIYSSNLSIASLTIDPVVSKVLTIENLTNYVEYIRKTREADELVIYHGGQFSPRKRAFLQAVAAALPENCRWYHWSDIDYGGFTMLARLRREIHSATLTYRMNIEELQRYSKLTAPIEAGYAQRLKTLKTHAELVDCYDCIDYMLANKVRLEQEAML